MPRADPSRERLGCGQPTLLRGHGIRSLRGALRTPDRARPPVAADLLGVPVTIEFGNQGKVSLNPAVPPGTVAVLERPASQEVETHPTPIVTVPCLTESEVSHKVPAAASTQATLDGTFSTPTPTSALMPILDLRPDSLTPNEAMTGGEAIHQETQAVNMAEKAEAETTNGVGGEPDEGVTEATRVMRERRPKPRDGPFRGFGSPPGKF